eukprot:2099779-Prymnesium_polylepis.1
MTESVLVDHKPCQRIKELCKNFSHTNHAFYDLCDGNDSALYDMLNRELGWYGEWDGESHSHKERVGNKPMVYEHGILPVTVNDIGLSEEDEWLLNALSNVYIKAFFPNFYASVADRIEERINDHFGKILKTLDGGDSGSWEDDPNLMYAVGCYNNVPVLEDLMAKDQNLYVLRNATKAMPTNDDMPLGFYKMIYYSKQLADILRKHSP